MSRDYTIMLTPDKFQRGKCHWRVTNGGVCRSGDPEGESDTMFEATMLAQQVAEWMENKHDAERNGLLFTTPMPS